MDEVGAQGTRLDVTQFTAHSGQSASMSFASQAGVALKDTLKEGRWSNAHTFAKHYNKPIDRNFGTSMLGHFKNPVLR